MLRLIGFEHVARHDVPQQVEDEGALRQQVVVSGTFRETCGRMPPDNTDALNG
jgi:hypothetical protein